MLQIPPHQQPLKRHSSAPSKISTAFEDLNLLHSKMAKAYRQRNALLAGRYLDRAMDAADAIISMPAKDMRDMLLKIAAAGVLVDAKDDTASLKDWQPLLHGFRCDDAAPKLLMTLRDDLLRLLEGK